MKTTLLLPALLTLALPLTAQELEKPPAPKTEITVVPPIHGEITIDKSGAREKRVLPLGRRGFGLTLDSTVDEKAAPKTWLGVVLDEVSEAVASQLPIEPGTGLIVEHVTPDSPAAKAGLQKHDVLLRLGDQVLIAPKQLQTLVANRRAGDTVEVHILRKGQPQTITATLATQPTGAVLGDHEATINLHGMSMDLDRLIKDAHDTAGSVIVNKKTVFVGPDGNPVTIDSDEIKEKTLHMLQKSGLNDETLQQVKKAIAEAQEQVRRAQDQARQATEHARKAAEEAQSAAQRAVKELQQRLEKKSGEPGGR